MDYTNFKCSNCDRDLKVGERAHSECAECEYRANSNTRTIEKYNASLRPADRSGWWTCPNCCNDWESAESICQWCDEPKPAPYNRISDTVLSEAYQQGFNNGKYGTAYISPKFAESEMALYTEGFRAGLKRRQNHKVALDK